MAQHLRSPHVAQLQYGEKEETAIPGDMDYIWRLQGQWYVYVVDLSYPLDALLMYRRQVSHSDELLRDAAVRHDEE